MRVLAFDFETHLIKPERAFPKAVCMSYQAADFDDAGAVRRWHAPAVVPAAEGIALLEQTLLDGTTILVGANTAFDVLVSVFNHADPERFLGLWTWAADRQRVTDVLLRQALIERAFDEYQKDYRLDAVAKRTCGIALDKSTDWRLNYHKLDGVPIAQYPREAYDYSLGDSTGALSVFVHQERRRRMGCPVFPGADILADQWRQQDAALALADLAGYGLRANPRTQARFEAAHTAERDQLREKLTTIGLVKLEYSRNLPAIAAYAERIGKPLPKTKKDKPSLARKNLLATGDAVLASLLEWPASAPMLVAQGLATAEWCKDTDAAAQRLLALNTAAGRPTTYTTPAKRKRAETNEAFSKRLANFQPKIKLDNDACTQTEDPALIDYAELSSLDTILGSPTEMARTAAAGPLCAHYRVLQKTGRTSTGSDGEGAKGNVQNQHRKPGVREQYEPRTRAAFPALFAALDQLKAAGYPVETEDRVYIDADYTMLELFTFSQICKWLLGWSALGDKLLEGLDVHLEIAADFEGLTYAEAKKLKKTPRISQSRTGGKGINFGRKGGMGAERFVQYAWNNYQMRLGGPNATPEQALAVAQRLIDLHDARTPEFPQYSQKMQALRRSHKRDSKFDLIHPGSGRCVAGLSFTDVHNYPFQGLASDVAKRALSLVFRARWGLSELGRNDPLYRCGVVLFVHDSITCEVVESKAVAASLRLSELMGCAAREVCPDYPSPAPGGPQRQLSKKAEPIAHPDGHPRAGELTGEIWDAWDQASRQAAKVAAKGGNVEKALAAADWPRYVIDDVAARFAARKEAAA